MESFRIAGLNPFFFRAGFEAWFRKRSPRLSGLNPFFFRAGFEVDDIVAHEAGPWS